MDLHLFLWKHRLKQKDFAELINVQPHTMSRLVTKKASPTLPVAIAIVKFTNHEVTYDDLLSDKDKLELGDQDFKK